MIRRVAIILALALAACGSRPPPPPPKFNCASENCESCAVLGAKLQWDPMSADYCSKCQGAPAGTADCLAPLRGGVYVIRGCDADSECSALGGACAHFTGWPHNTCVEGDAI